MATVEDIANQLKTDPLFVDPAGMREFETAGYQLDREATSSRLKGSGEEIYVAILPNEMADPKFAPTELGPELADGPSSLTVVALFAPAREGDRVQLSAASSTGLSGVQGAAETAIGSGDGDLSAGIGSFVDQVESALDGSSDGSGSDGGGGGGGWLPLGILAAVGGGGFLLYRRNQRNRERAQLEEVRKALDEDITAYGEQLTALDLDVRSSSTLPEAANVEYGKALDLYDTAKEAADRAERPTDLKRVTTALEEGRWLLSCVDARLKGDPVPERRLPCFFDPSHGPSVEDVQWAPRGGTMRSVPACAADAQRIGHGEDPESRMVRTADGERPYWEAGPAYAGWAGGYYGGFLPGILWGTMLGSALSGPVYVGDGGGDGGGFDGGGGDFGGWDGGGGDFGGFDGGGGDFGGF